MFTIDDLIVYSRGSIASVKIDMPISGLSIDTRTIQPSECFVAIRGETFDGHSFLRAAYGRKATAFIVDRSYYNALIKYQTTERDAIADLPNLIVVDNTIEALGHIACSIRRTFSGGCVGITGSCGKTTTKELTAKVLETKHTVLYTQGNLNNHLGLPLTLSRLGSHYSMLVSEMGASRSGDIAYLSNILRPEVGVITNIHPVHLEGFGSIENVYKSKLEIGEFLDLHNGTLIVNGDDEYLLREAKNYNVTLVTFGKKKHNDFMLTDCCYIDRHVEFTVNGTYRFILNTIVDYNVYNALAALAVADYYKIDFGHLHNVFAQYTELAGRFKIVEGNILLIDDSYNANPYSFTQVLKFLGKVKAKKRKIVVCGDMLELGSFSKDYHYELGKEIIAAGADIVVGVGKEIIHTMDSIVDNSPETECFYCTNNEDAVLLLRQEVHKGDVVLIKASRGIKLDLVVDSLTRVYCSQDLMPV